MMMKHPVLQDYADILRCAGVAVVGDNEADCGESLFSNQTGSSCSVLDLALRRAAEAQDVAAVRFLLGIGADPDSGVTRKSKGVSALHAAVTNCNEEIVKLILAAGGKTSVCTANHLTPAHVAAQRSPPILRMLLEAGAPVRMEDGARQTLLHYAARAGQKEAVSLLLPLAQKQRVLDSRDRWQRTPLHWAVLNGHLTVVRMLLDAGARKQPYDPRHLKRLENKMGHHTHLPMETPLKLACRVHGSHSEFTQLLMDLVDNPHLANNDSAGPSGASSCELVSGLYTYYHYLCDGFDDRGWGCAYRTGQTLMSWCKHAVKGSMAVPTVHEMQKVLVETGDKPKVFEGSHDWIGSIELSLLLNHLFGATCRIVSICATRAGELRPYEEFNSVALPALRNYFVNDIAAPVMVGGDSGGALAILGVAMRGECAYLLILDPHFAGDNVYAHLPRFCYWTEPRKIFSASTFYNFLFIDNVDTSKGLACGQNEVEGHKGGSASEEDFHAWGIETVTDGFGE